MFESIQIEGWRQFRSVTIDFHPRLTVLTGANGSGKTTILNLLNRHVGWNLPFVSTPLRRRKGPIQFISDFWKKVRPDDEQSGRRRIGRINYRSGQTAELSVPETVAESYEVGIRGQQPIPGLFVSSHRPVYRFERVREIPTELDPGQQLIDLYLSDIRAPFIGGGGRSPSYQIKRALISLVTFGYGSKYVQRNEDAVRTFEGFQEILRVVLPPSLGFEHIEVRMPEVVLVTKTGDFSLDAGSGGLSALIDVSWQIFLRSQLDDAFVVLIDEPENHLHPELQRTVLPSLLQVFSGAQFIVATHNPFIISAVRDSNVYVLQFSGDQKDQKVGSSPLDMVNKAGSSNEILRDVLGLPNAMPLWVERRIGEIVSNYATATLDESTLLRIKADLSELGMGDLLPETLTRVLDQRGD